MDKLSCTTDGSLRPCVAQLSVPPPCAMESIGRKLDVPARPPAAAVAQGVMALAKIFAQFSFNRTIE